MIIKHFTDKESAEIDAKASQLAFKLARARPGSLIKVESKRDEPIEVQVLDAPIPE